MRTLRTGHHLSLRALAARAGFSPSFISQVENGQASPSIASLERIVGAPGLTLGEFFSQQIAGSPAVVRIEERPAHSSTQPQTKFTALAPHGPSHGLEPMVLTLETGGRSGPHSHLYCGEAFAFVFVGEVLLALGETVHRLSRGDSATFQSDTHHVWHNPRNEIARVVLVSIRGENQQANVSDRVQSRTSAHHREP